MSTPFQNDFVTISMVQDILYVHYKQTEKIDLAAAKIIVRDRMRFQDQLALPILCDISEVKSIDLMARNYLANEGSDLTKAVALLYKDGAHHLMSSYYVDVCKPTVTTRIFNNEASALAFLNNYKKALL